MLFTSIDFLLFFFVVLGFIAIFHYRKFQHLFLIFASFFFLYYTDNYLVILLVAIILLNFYTGKAIFSSKSTKCKKLFFIIGLGGSLGTLGFFKYADFAIMQFNLLGNYFDLNSEIPFLNLALPIGISFYTFQSLSYIFDIYRGTLKPCESLKEFSLFVAFFPPLVAGPIVRASVFLPQLKEKIQNVKNSTKLRQIIIHNKNLKFGITLMSIGFFKKMFFADNISPLVDNIFSNPIGLESFSIMLGAFAFGIQIYCDFSGYSDIAIGAAAIFGFKIPLNFNKPFFARSPSDYWSRWHISLSSWVRDYLYYPLVFKNRKKDIVVFSSLLFSMLLMGLWHGASWNFIIWGGIHGLFLAFHTILRTKIPQSSTNFFKSRIGIVFSIIVTQYLVFFTFLAFRIQDFEHMLYSMQKYVFLDFATSQTLEIISNNEFAVSLIVLFIILHFISFKKDNLVKRISEFRLSYWGLFLFMIILPITLFYVGSSQQFIYFQF
tara:strand:- start:3150 stop:4622 length:1473 start_codon:yes stop_codon:yes gene_type:complete